MSGREWFEQTAKVSARIERILTKFADSGPCCAGCRHWHYMNSLVGECRRSAPVSGAQRVAMLGMRGCSLEIGAGHVLTPRGHHCGEFTDNMEVDGDG